MIYVAEAENGMVKIGQSIKPKERVKLFTFSGPLQVRLIAIVEGGSEEEWSLHQRFDDHRRHNEWFVCEGAVADFVSSIRGIGLDGPIADWIIDHAELRRTNKERAKVSRAEKHKLMWADPEYRSYRSRCAQMAVRHSRGNA